MHFFLARDKKKVVFYGPRKKKFDHHWYRVQTTDYSSYSMVSIIPWF
jgi:hypothetical protein